MDFFRHCPNCGHRFHIKLESKQLEAFLGREKMTTPSTTIVSDHGPIMNLGYLVIVDIDEFQYNYKCTLCGHQWSEKRVEKDVVKGSTLPPP